MENTHALLVISEQSLLDDRIVEPIAYLRAFRGGHPTGILPAMARMWAPSGPYLSTPTSLVRHLLAPTQNPYPSTVGWDLLSERAYRHELEAASLTQRVERVDLSNESARTWTYEIMFPNRVDPITVAVALLGEQPTVINSLVGLWQYVEKVAKERAGWLTKHKRDAQEMETLAERVAAEAVLAAMTD